MTVKEFYEWAVANNVENLEMEVQYRDDGGCYYGSDNEVIASVTKSNYSDNQIVLL